MIEQDWRRRIDRLASYYRHGIYTALEVQSTAVEAVPIEAVGELISRLPAEICQRIRERAVETEWSEDWPPLISINGPQQTEDSQRLFRLKMAALRALFESEETTNQRH
jgi:hypothetical protein